MSFQIKSIERADLAEVNQLMARSKATWGYDEAYMTQFMQNLEVTDWYVRNFNAYKGVLDGALVGFFGFSSEHGRAWELDYFFIEPSRMGEGIGRRLWAEALQKAQGLGITSFNLWSDPGAEGFYIKMGCRKRTERPSELLPGRFLPVLEYVL